LPSDDQVLYTHCSASLAGIVKEPALANVVPTPASVTIDLNTLSGCLLAAEGAGPIETTELKAAAEAVRQDWQLLAKSVQRILRAGPSEAVPAILANILMYQSNVGQRKPKAPLEVEQPPGWPSGSVHAVALAVVGALTYGWEWSLDQLAWNVVTTGKSFTTLTGFTPGKVYWFRVRAFLRGDTMTAYTQTVSLMVK
jgi:hypothetical protein